MSDATPAAEPDIVELTHQFMEAIPEDLRQKSLDALDAIAEGATLGDLQGIDPRKLEMVYSVARTFYMNEKYDDAQKLFRFLALMDHTDEKYWFGLGSTLQMLKDFEGAVEAFAHATILDLDDPKPQLQAGYCLIQLEKYPEAQCALEGVLLTDELDAKTKLQAEALLDQVRRAASEEE